MCKISDQMFAWVVCESAQIVSKQALSEQVSLCSKDFCSKDFCSKDFCNRICTKDMNFVLLSRKEMSISVCRRVCLCEDQNVL